MSTRANSVSSAVVALILIGGQFSIAQPKASPSAAAEKQVSLPSVQTEGADRFTSAVARELFRASGGDPQRFIELPLRDGIPLAATREVLDQEDLPKLFAILTDPDRAALWNRAAVVIGYIGNDAESAKALMDFARRPIPWAKVAKGREFSVVLTKCSVVRLLGHMNYPERDETLLHAFSEEGANEIVKEWINDPALPNWALNNRNNVIGHVRGSAANGLVLTCDPKLWARVDEAYRQASAEAATPANEEIYNMLVDAMATKQMIAENGFEYFAKFFGSREFSTAQVPYLRKFNTRR